MKNPLAKHGNYLSPFGPKIHAYKHVFCGWKSRERERGGRLSSWVRPGARANVWQLFLYHHYQTNTCMHKHTHVHTHTYTYTNISRNMHMNMASSHVWLSGCLFVGVMAGFRKDLTVFVMHNFAQQTTEWEWEREREREGEWVSVNGTETWPTETHA